MIIYVINLDANPERLVHISSRLQSLGLSFQRIAAVDGHQMSPEDRAAFAAERPRMGGGNKWLSGQIGCFLSHFEAWSRVAAGADELALILEDDVHLSTSLPDFVQDYSWVPEGAEILRIEANGQWLMIENSRAARDRQVGQVMSTAWCASGYIVTRAAAHRLMEMPVLLHEPADAMLFHRNLPQRQRLAVWQLHPALCAQDKYRMSIFKTLGFRSNIEADDKADSVRLLLQSVKRSIFSRLLGKTRIDYK